MTDRFARILECFCHKL